MGACMYHLNMYIVHVFVSLYVYQKSMYSTFGTILIKNEKFFQLVTLKISKIVFDNPGGI